MSAIKVGRTLGNAVGGTLTEVQYDATNNRDNAQHHFIPLNKTGAAVLVSSEGVMIEAPVTIRAAAVLTGSYVLATAVDLTRHNYVRFRATVDTAQAVTISIKVAYSMVGGAAANWDYLQSDQYGTISGTDIPVTGYDMLYSLDLTSTANVWASTFLKRARYCTVAVKYTGATTGKVAVTAQRFNA